MSWNQSTQMIIMPEASKCDGHHHRQSPFGFAESTPQSGGHKTPATILFNVQKSQTTAKNCSDDNNNNTTTASSCNNCIAGDVFDSKFLTKFFNNPTSQQQPLLLPKQSLYSPLNGVTSATQTATVTAVITPKLSASVTTNARLPSGKGKGRHHTNNRRSNNICVVRPQLQQRPRQKPYQQQRQCKALSAKETLVADESAEDVSAFKHTPSLWQTPLILAKAPTPVTPSNVTPVPVPASPVTPAVLSDFAQVQVTTETAATAMVAPIFVPHSVAGAQTSLAPSKQSKDQSLAFRPLEHSNNANIESEDPNEIPVNVIYRQKQHLRPQLQSQPQLHPHITGDTPTLEPKKTESLTINASSGSSPINVAPPLALPAHTTHFLLPAQQTKQQQPQKLPLQPQKIIMPRQSSLVLKQQQDHKKSSLISNLSSSNVKRKTVTTVSKGRRRKGAATAATAMANALNVLQPKNENVLSAKQTLPKKTRNKRNLLAANTVKNLPVSAAVSTQAKVKAHSHVNANSFDYDECSIENINDYLAITKPLKSCHMQNTWLTPTDVLKASVIESAHMNGFSSRNEREKFIVQQKCFLLRKINQYECASLSNKRNVKKHPRTIRDIENLEKKGATAATTRLPAKKCSWTGCASPSVELSQYCMYHLAQTTQELFTPCIAKLADGTACNAPVFDLLNNGKFCVEHQLKKPTQRLESSAQQLQRATSATSLESIASNSQSSFASRQQERVQYKYQSAYSSNTHGSTYQVQQQLPPSTSAYNTNQQVPITDINYANPMMSSNNQAEEVRQILAQLTAGYPENNANARGNGNVGQLTAVSGESRVGEDEASSFNILSFADDNSHNEELGRNQLMPQGMFPIGENSSPYASSDDTGFCGLSESEHFMGTQLADAIPLGDTPLLAEQDFNHILNDLPLDNFNDLFASVAVNTTGTSDVLVDVLDLVNEDLKTLQPTNGHDLFGSLLNNSEPIVGDDSLAM